MKAITNIDGNFQIDGLDKEKTYTLYINYIGYKTQKIDGVQAKDADQVIALQPDDTKVTPYAKKILNTETSFTINNYLCNQYGIKQQNNSHLTIIRI